jgi:hypothetical protein
MKRITAVHVTPVKMARRGRRWTRKNGIDVRGLILPWGSRSAAMVHLPGSSAIRARG